MREPLLLILALGGSDKYPIKGCFNRKEDVPEERPDKYLAAFEKLEKAIADISAELANPAEEA